MTRQRHATASAPDAAGAAAADPEQQATRAAAFSKTKMCKFFILGECKKGAGCYFAHSKEQLKGLPDLARTKLCKSLINTGVCDDPLCHYAHTRGELRPAPVPDAIPKRQQKKTRQTHGPIAIETQQQPPQWPRPQQPQQGGEESQNFQGQAQLQMPQTQQANQPVAPAPSSPYLVAMPSPGVPPMQVPMAQCAASAPQQLYPSLLLQMGQAAQAYAYEAARLQQAMVLVMQMPTNGATAPAAVPGAAAAPWLGPGVVGLGQCLLPQGVPAGTPQMFAQAIGYPPISGASWSPPMGPSPPPLPQAEWALGGPMPEKAMPETPMDMGSFRSVLTRALSKDPLQINTLTLKSLSQSSLPYLTATADALDDLPFVEAKRSFDFDSPLGFTAAVDQHAEAERRWRELGDSHAISFDRSEIHVKNTFLDIDVPGAPQAPLRAVHTAGGRLDLMGRQASGMCLGVLDEDDES